jgi:hypothetical protein
MDGMKWNDDYVLNASWWWFKFGIFRSQEWDMLILFIRATQVSVMKLNTLFIAAWSVEIIEEFDSVLK